MDLVKIGNFIKTMRKQIGLTQSELAQRLGVSDRAISKWETGACLPDADNMLALCGILGISINDLFNGGIVDMTDDKELLERNLIEMTKRKEEADKRLLTLEIVIGTISVIVLLGAVLLAGLLNIATWLRYVLGIGGAVVGLVGLFFSLLAEQKAGYYCCAKCGHRYVPSYLKMLGAMHAGRTRYMKCPHCGKYSWQRKVLSDTQDNR